MPFNQQTLLGSDIGKNVEGISQVLKTKASELFQTIRSNPVLSAGIPAGGALAGLAVRQIIKRRKKKSGKRKRKTTKRRRRSRRKATRRTRRRTGTRRRKRRGRRAIIRGPGLGSREIKHSGRIGKGKVKLVSFKTKSGKRVSFRVRR